MEGDSGTEDRDELSSAEPGSSISSGRLSDCFTRKFGCKSHSADSQATQPKPGLAVGGRAIHPAKQLCHPSGCL